MMLLAISGSVFAQTRTMRVTNGSVPSTGGQVTLNVQLDSLGNESSTSFSLTFNPAVLTNPQVVIGNGVPTGSNLGLNTTGVPQGNLGVLVDSTNTYAAGTRNVIAVTFTVPAGVQQIQYPVAFSDTPTVRSVSSNQGALLPTTYVNGVVQVGGTAAGVDVSGRVVTPDGRGIRNARVVITDTTGTQRIATTSSFGFYNFRDVEAGNTYTIAVQSKQYRFTPRVIQIVDTLTDFDFVGQQ